MKQPHFFRGGWLFLYAAAAFALFSANAAAQSKDSLVVSGEAAKRSLTNGEISGDAAAKVAQGCLDFAAKHNFAAAVVILDPTGNIIHSHRMDGVRPDEIESALNRARAALFNRNPTNSAPNPNANVVAAVRGSLARGFDPSPGGLPLILDNQMIGAIGVAGSDSLNADCGRAGVAAVPGLMVPSPPTPPAQAQPQR
jgi:glc operon protein GlcG